MWDREYYKGILKRTSFGLNCIEKYFIIRFKLLFVMFLSHRLSSGECGNSYDSGYSGRDSSASNMTCNPDMQSCIPQIMQLLDQVHSGQQQILQLWQIKKAKLDQCLQLRLFEQECEKVIRLQSRKAGSHYLTWPISYLRCYISI